MKNIILFLTITALFCSCEKNAEEVQIDTPSGVVIDFRINILVTDGMLQDRLNPESPAYFGEEYVEGIKLYTIVNGEKRMIEYPLINEPFRWYVDKDGNSSQSYNGTLGYYFIQFPFPKIGGYIEESGKIYMYLYIQYLDGSEDVIKIQEYKNETGSIHSFDKLWINGELAFELIHPEFYYNTKYFQWLVPVLGDDGKQIGNKVMPKDGFNVVIKKDLM